MTDFVMFAVVLERLIAPERLGILDGTLGGARMKMIRELFRADGLDDLSMDPPLTFQAAKDDAILTCVAAPFSVAPALRASLIEFDLAFQYVGPQFNRAKRCFSEPLIGGADDLVRDIQVGSQAICQLQLVRALLDLDLATKSREAIGLAATRAFQAHTTYAAALKSATEHALFTPQEVGRATKKRADLLSPSALTLLRYL